MPPKQKVSADKPAKSKSPNATEGGPISLKTIEELAKHFDAPEEFVITHAGQAFSVQLHPVRDDNGQADAFIDIVPPVVKEAEPGKPAVYDEADKEFRKKLSNGWDLRRAFFIERGSSLAPIPGESWEAKAEYLRKNFPRKLVIELAEAIENLSFADAEVIRRANFTSESASLKS